MITAEFAIALTKVLINIGFACVVALIVSVCVIMGVWFATAWQGLVDHVLFKYLSEDLDRFNKFKNLILYKIDDEEVRKEIIECFRKS